MKDALLYSGKPDNRGGLSSLQKHLIRAQDITETPALQWLLALTCVPAL